MSAESEKLYIPPFCGVRMVEYHDHLALMPVPSYRVVYGYGRMKATEATFETEDGKSEPLWDNCGPDEEIWGIIELFRFEDGYEEKGDCRYIRHSVTEAEIQKKIQEMQEFYRMSREELLRLTQCYDEPEEERAATLAWIDASHPNYQFAPAGPKAIDDYDVYQARLKVLAGLQPTTVELIRIANAMEDSEKRQRVEREAVGAYFAELAHYFTEEEVRAWQRSNPVGTGWLCEFGSVFHYPRRQIDRVNHELALNWLRRKYNLLTAEELSDEIFKATLVRLAPEALKKRRERLGLTTKRPPGPPPKQPFQ
jgi:hypothetical protein